MQKARLFVKADDAHGHTPHLALMASMTARMF